MQLFNEITRGIEIWFEINILTLVNYQLIEPPTSVGNITDD